MRIRTILAAAAAPAALAAALLGTAVAPAAHASALTAGPGNGTVSASNTLTGNKSDAQSYNDPVFGPVKVNETQHPAFDTVSAKFTGGQTMTPNQPGQVGWNSDFGSAALRGHTQTGLLTYTINADGTGYTGQVTYPNG